MGKLGLRCSESWELISSSEKSVSINTKLWFLHSKPVVQSPASQTVWTSVCISVSVMYIKLTLLISATRDLMKASGQPPMQLSWMTKAMQDSEVDPVAVQFTVSLQRAVVLGAIPSTATEHTSAHVNEWPQGLCPFRHGHILSLSTGVIIALLNLLDVFIISPWPFQLSLFSLFNKYIHTFVDRTNIW